MPETARFSGRRAMVTGGTRGIGLAICKRLASEGAAVFATGTQQTPASPLPAGCEYLGYDFSNESEVENCASFIAKNQIDLLVNNAGINKIAPFETIELADLRRIEQVNLHAPFRLCQAALPFMRKRSWGRIVNISSIFGKISREQRASYSASKFALDGLTLALAVEVAADGVLANCIAPGFIDTDLTRRILGESGIAELSERIPAKRLGRADEIAALACWLLSPENTYLTGQNIAIDGGFSRV